MKVLGICGSPRKGNTEAMIREILKGAESAGAETKLLLLRKYNIGQCTGCDICWDKGERCVIRDDWDDIEPELLEAEAWILGSPTYFDNVSALMKIFIDRTNPYCKPENFKGRKAGVVCVGGQELKSIRHCEEAIKRFIEGQLMVFSGSVIARADKPGEVKGQKARLKECFELGRKTASGK